MEKLRISLELTAYRIDQNGFAALFVGKQVRVGGGLTVKQLTEQHGVLSQTPGQTASSMNNTSKLRAKPVASQTKQQEPMISGHYRSLVSGNEFIR